MNIEELFDAVRPVTHGNAKPLEFRRVPCETLDIDGTPVHGDCIECVSHKPNGRGYAQLRVGGKNLRLHRFVWEQVNGPIPDGHEIDHRCRNRACVNREHLQLLTEKEHELKTVIERQLFEEHEDREAAMVFMHLNPEVARKAVAKLFNAGVSTVGKWKREWKARRAFRESLSESVSQ